MTNHPKKKSSGRHHFTQLKTSAQKYSVRSANAAVLVEQPKHLDRPTSSAEITEITPPEKHFSLRTALRSFGKKRNPIYGAATDLVEQTGISNPVGRFVPDEPMIDDSAQDENIVILERGMSAVPRQDAATRPDTPARRQNTTESQEYNATKAVRQTATIGSSSVPDTRFEINLLQQPLKPTFFDNVARPFSDNVAPPFFRVPLPELNKCFNSTLQLAFARHLLLTKKMSRSSSMPASLSTVEDSTQAMGLEGTDLLWMRAISKDPIEQDRLCRLTAQVAFQFLESNYKDAKSIAEVILLGSVLDHQDYRGVLSSLIRQLEQEPLLESAVLVGVVYFLESAPPGYLIDDDLVKILRVLRKRLEDTHMQLGDTKEPVSEPIYPLAIAISRVLDKMVQGNIKGLRRTEDHRPLLNILAGLKDSPDLCLKYQATCAWQALQYIGDDESPLDMAVRVGGGLVMAGLGVASALKLDIEGLFNGLRELGEAAGQIRDATETVIASVQTAREAGEGVVDSLLKGFRAGNKRAWYPALQGARVVISEGRLAEFRRIVYEVPCCRVQEFQWGICQLLGEIAMDPIWVMEIRLQAVYFLEDLLRSDSEWTTDSSVREAIRSILLRISTSGEKTIQIHFNSLLQDSRRENGDDSAEPYPLITRLPTPGSFPLLAKALKAPSLEYDLHRVMAQRLGAHQQAAYIPPYAKANLTASDERFPLMDKVMEFLRSDREVFLILGDSGSGKTTFNRHLEYVLIKDYKQGGPIPVFIHLPGSRNPEKELISEHLKTLSFTNNDIQELKRHRQFIIICDSYDESRLKINLHLTNMLNQPGQWKVKLIISCRSTHTSANCLHRFQPQPVDRYSPSTLHLFQQAVIVPFSEDQIKDYVDQFVRNTELHKVLRVRSVWSTAEYMDKLTRIPNLLALVTNPFLLNLSLRSLPVAFKDDLDPSTIAKVTRPKLYRIFIDEWLEVNRCRLLHMNHSEATTTKLNDLIEAGFHRIAIDFLQDLAKAIYKEQAGNSVVRYVHRDDKETWKAKFFGPDEEITLLRQSSPLTCVENLHSFIHRSLLEYFRSLQMAKLVPTINKLENEQVETRPRSMSQTNNQQTDLLQEYSTTNDQRKQSNPHSPSLTPLPHQNTQHIMAFSISNALDPESSFISTNILANTLEKNTSRDACVDTTLDAESDGSASSDDEFEDAQEYLSDDSLERITQDESHKTIDSAKVPLQVTYHKSFGIRGEEREVSVSERSTYEVKAYEPTTTTTTTTEGEIVLEHVQKDVIVDKKVEVDADVSVEVDVEVEKKEAKEIIIIKETGVVAKPAAPKGTSWFRKIATATGAAVVGAGAVAVGAGALAVGAVHDVASGAGHAAHGALEKVDGVWKRTVQVLTTRKAHVDAVAPIANTSNVYYDDEVYDAVLVEKSTGVTYVTQLLFDSATSKYYVYIRWGETDYKLDGPHETVESAKAAFQVTYRENFGVQWEERETTVSERFTYEVKTYETFETIEEVEEIVEETEAVAIIAREQEIVTQDEVITTETTTTTTTTTTTEGETVLEHVQKDVIVDKKVEVDVDVSVEVDVEVEKKEAKEIIITKETCVVAKPAAPKGNSWFRRLATGAGMAAAGALTQVDGVWKRTVQVHTTRKAHVDAVAPIAKTSYVYYDDEVYDAVLTEKSTGVTYVTQLLVDNSTAKYYVYIRWGETDYKLNGPHDIIESAKAAFQISYREQFGVQWENRETTVSERFTYEVKTYETFETTEEMEEIVEDYEISEVVVKENFLIEDERVVSTRHSITSSHDDTVVRNVSEQVLFKKGADVGAAELSRTQYETLTRVDSTTSAGSGAIFGGAAVILGGAAAAGATHHGGASSTAVVEETKKAVFDFSSLPVLPHQGIDVETGASVGVIDLTSDTAEAYRELPCHLRPRAWVSLHVGGWQDAPHELEGFMRLDDQSGQRLMESARDAAQGKAQEATSIDNLHLLEIVALFAKKLYGHFGEELPAELSVERLCELDDDETKREVVDEVKAAPSLSFPKCEISGIPESLSDLTTTSLVFEMRDSPIFDDESLGAMDLEEEQDILQFLVEQVHEDTDYTKLLLWTVYKSLTEGIINQSTKNAACILEKAGIQFQPQL